MRLILYSFVILIFCKWLSCQMQAGQKRSGDYVLKITYIEACDKQNDTRQMGFFNTKMYKSNRTHSCLSGDYHLPFGLSDDMRETWDLYTRGTTGGWKRFISFDNKKACSDKRKHFPEWFDLFEKENTTCPIPAGTYSFSCVNITGRKFSAAKVLAYGEYRLKVHVYHNNTVVGCTDFRAEIIPKDERN